jgi:signal transduction histidine kinase/DNA-binding response OmpR family regulator
MSESRPRVLLAEDDAAHVEAIRRAFQGGRAGADIEVVGTLGEYRAVAGSRPPDIALLDLNLPDGRAVEALSAPADAAGFPVLIMTSFGDEQIAVESMKAGALDYIVKSPETLSTMPRIVERALREWDLLRSRRRHEARILHLNSVLRGIRNVNQLITKERDPIALIRKACELLVDSRGFYSCFIVVCDGERVRFWADAGADEKVAALRAMLSRGELPGCMRAALREGQAVVRHKATDACRACPVDEGYQAMRDAVAVRLAGEGRSAGVLLASLPTGMAEDAEEIELLEEVASDVGFALGSIQLQAQRDAVEEALRSSERRYRSLFENTSVGLAHCRMLYDGGEPEDFVFLIVNSTFAALTGLKDVTGKRLSDVVPGVRESDPELIATCARVARSGTPERFEIYLEALRGWFDVSVHSPQRDHVVAVFDLITERKRAEESLVRLSRRLEQLTQIVQSLSQARSVEAIVDLVRRAARALAGSDGATFVLREGDQCHYVDEDAIGPLWKGKRFPMSACVSGWVMMNREAAVIEDISADPRIPRDVYEPTFVRSLVMVPIRGQDPIGAIGSYWAKPHRASPEDVRILQALADSTSVAMENVRVLRELEEGEARTRAIYDHLPHATFLWKRQDPGFVLADFNEAARDVTKGGVGQFLGKRPHELSHAFPHMDEDLARCFAERRMVRREVRCTVPGSEALRQLVLTYGFIPSDLVIHHAEDVTERRQTEEQLKLAQRLEAVGRLAGGVAHDFNNLLSVIISYAGLAAQALRESDPVRADILEIQHASQRAAALTRQLLAFSRKQLLEPEVFGMNEVVTGIEAMLRRLLGEDIDIEVHLAADAGNVLADRGQLEQVLMNLAVNSRDAMPQGGKLTIVTRNVEFSQDYANQQLSLKPGRFVMLAVADTGCGMDAESKAHLFEPFFTTKAKGKGTGLGLSTVYGIVKQSGGNIWAYSEPEHGTTFKVYLPRVDAPAAEARRRPTSVTEAGSETVLLAEDEDAVRRLAERVLRSAGYRVLPASTGGDALILFERHGAEIDMLLTDVVMPQMSGRELAERLTKLHPKLKVLYMSGYTDNAIVHHGVLDPGTRFIGKPFSAVELARKVREVLDGDSK